jgi:hypothetical protein
MSKRKIIYISIALLGFGYLLGTEKEIFQKKAEKPEETYSKNMEAGPIGEVMVKEEETGQEAPLVSPTMPPVVFSVGGTVTKIESDRVIIRSNGYHFADNVPRDVTAVLTADTATFVTGQAFRWKGFFGLKHLEVGMEIIVESQENIRGKTEFKAKTINIL